MKNKPASIVLITLLILGLGIVGTAYYFYEFHTFKTIRICLGGEENTTLSCSLKEDCISRLGDENLQRALSDSPDFLKEKFKELVDKAIDCNMTCRIKNIRGINFDQGIPEISSCSQNETEISLDIHGKEALAMWQYYKKIKGSNDSVPN